MPDNDKKQGPLDGGQVTWTRDRLAPVESMLFRSRLVKVGRFRCAPDHACFSRTEALDNEVFVFPRSALWLRRDAGEFRFVEPGGILLHRAGSAIDRRRAGNNGEQTYWFGISPDVFVESLERCCLSTEEMGGSLIAEPRLRYRLARLLRQVELDDIDTLGVEEEVLSLFFEICEQRAERRRHDVSMRTGAAARHRRLADAARACIDERLAESVGLASMARELGTSPYHLCRIFREQTGITMHAYRTRQRLGSVVDCLVAGYAGKLIELSLEHGFSSHGHLSRVFQQQFGVSPSSLRTANALHT